MMQQQQQNQIQQIQTPQSTQIYLFISNLQSKIYERYDAAPTKSRYLILNPAYALLNEMHGDYCSAFTTRNPRVKCERLVELRNKYYRVEGYFQKMTDEHIITLGYSHEISKTLLTPLIKMIQAQIKRFSNTPDCNG